MYWLFPIGAFCKSYDYDNLDRLTRVVYENGQVIDYAYDPGGNLLSVSYPEITIAIATRYEPSDIILGQPFTYHWTLTNHHAVATDPLQVTLQLPEGFAATAIQLESASCALQSLTCSAPALAPGATIAGSLQLAAPASELGDYRVWITLGDTNRYPDIYRQSTPFALKPDAGLFDIPLASGWNLISLPITPDDPAPDALLAGQDVAVAWGFGNGLWQRYSPGIPSSLTRFEAGMGYWLQANQGGTLRIHGRNAPSSLQLQPGWNLIGYPGPQAQPIADVLSAIQGQFDVVWSMEDGQWKTYKPPVIHSLAEMKPGQGYWIHITAVQAITLNF